MTAWFSKYQSTENSSSNWKHLKNYTEAKWWLSFTLNMEWLTEEKSEIILRYAQKIHKLCGKLIGTYAKLQDNKYNH